MKALNGIQNPQEMPTRRTKFMVKIMEGSAANETPSRSFSTAWATALKTQLKRN